ncbi:pirin family protein [Sphingorhabdus sp. SMR4y]|uniref:pirin family protein n=1 Tax=Sphingorhabdus sp. SMR4y TaxID=2584094 RepID=UPI000B5FD588|nr:pirin family protein [Sphingorhabdus sp. SMR4y]ASK89700.1 pirin [Sphingorhabdus sp. SMR4y]
MTDPETKQKPSIVHRTRGHSQGPITRLFSPGDLGQILKPFVFLDFFKADTSVNGRMPYHPHSGIVTVTTIFEGGMTYEDSTDKSGKLVTGSVEWMQAGGGVWHTGGPLPEAGNIIRGMQLWLTLPQELENSDPVSLYIDPDEIKRAGPARVIIGEYEGVASPLPAILPMTYLHIQLDDGEEWTFTKPHDHDLLWLGIDEGSLQVADETLHNEVAVFDGNTDNLTMKAVGQTNLVLGSASRHLHPLVTGSYSVHTTPEALKNGEAGIVRVGQRLRSKGLL